MFPQANFTIIIIITRACEACDGDCAGAVAWEEVPEVPLANRCGCVSECVSGDAADQRPSGWKTSGNETGALMLNTDSTITDQTFKGSLS